MTTEAPATPTPAVEPVAAVREPVKTAAPDTTTSYVLEISTALKTTAKFAVDGQEYSILTFAHLSAEDEANVTGLLARYERMNMALEVTGSDAEAQSLAKRLRERRIDILCKLTTLPRNVAHELPLPSQAALFNVVQRELAPGDDD